jgi:hypothetical protein
MLGAQQHKRSTAENSAAGIQFSWQSLFLSLVVIIRLRFQMTV